MRRVVKHRCWVHELGPLSGPRCVLTSGHEGKCDFDPDHFDWGRFEEGGLVPDHDIQDPEDDLAVEPDVP